MTTFMHADRKAVTIIEVSGEYDRGKLAMFIQ
jgi:hypothetical protein